jgi:hypothetical protein
MSLQKDILILAQMKPDAAAAFLDGVFNCLSAFEVEFVTATFRHREQFRCVRKGDFAIIDDRAGQGRAHLLSLTIEIRRFLKELGA